MLLNCASLDQIRHIAVFASWYPAGAQGLNGNFIRDFAVLLSSRYLVSVVYVGAAPELEEDELIIERNGNLSEYLARLPHKKGLLGFIRHQLNWWKHIRLFWKRLSKEHGRPDLIQVQVVWKMGLAALWYSRKYRVPFIVHEHWTGYFPADPQLKGLRRLWHRLVLVRAKGVSAVSRPLAVALEALGAPKPAAVLMNAVVTPAAQEPRSPFAHFLHVSNFREEQKQSRTVALVFQRLRAEFPMARLTMAGAVPVDFQSEFERIQGLEFSGICSRQELSELYSRATAVVSYSRFETFALSIAEGLMHGTPAIYTACGGPETYMQPHWGLCADADDPDTLFQCMRSFCLERGRWNHEQIAVEAQQSFSREHLLTAFDHMLKNLN